MFTYFGIKKLAFNHVLADRSEAQAKDTTEIKIPSGRLRIYDYNLENFIFIAFSKLPDFF